MGADITYIRWPAEFIYLVAIPDWYSRYVVGWELSNSLEVSFCLWAMDQALAPARPKILNSDRGSNLPVVPSRVSRKRLGSAPVRTVGQRV